MADKPKIFSEDATAIAAQVKTELETQLGKTIAPADIEQLLLNGFAYQQLLRNIQGNQALAQNLVRFATGVSLDYLCEQLSVTRIPAVGAVCTLQFTLDAGNTGVVLPAGMQVKTTDQAIVFITDKQVITTNGQTSATVTATALTTGAAGNGYAIGKVSVLMDLQPFVTAVANTDETNGGADTETDEQLRTRYPLALSTFSTCGPEQAYIYWAKTANPDIIDVKIVTPTGGTVNIYVLMKGGVIPGSEVLSAVQAACTAEKRRPLCDTVVALAPTVHDYSIDIDVVLYDGVDETDTTTLINTALTNLVNAGKNTLGKDVVVSQILAAAKIEGKVYDVTVNSPSTNYVAADSVYTNCTGITINVTGTANG